MVIASAAREIAVRHLARKRYRMAEMRVPEWAIPIQNTKLTMYVTHMTDGWYPADPMPVEIW
jgi:hypothetical protein